MKIKNITVDGYAFNERQTFMLIDLCMIHEGLKEEDVEHYLRNHKVEERDDEIILRNPVFYGRHFAVRKNI